MIKAHLGKDFDKLASAYRGEGYLNLVNALIKHDPDTLELLKVNQGFIELNPDDSIIVSLEKLSVIKKKIPNTEDPELILGIVNDAKAIELEPEN